MTPLSVPMEPMTNSDLGPLGTGEAGVGPGAAEGDGALDEPETGLVPPAAGRGVADGVCGVALAAAARAEPAGVVEPAFLCGVDATLGVADGAEAVSTPGAVSGVALGACPGMVAPGVAGVAAASPSSWAASSRSLCVEPQAPATRAAQRAAAAVARRLRRPNGDICMTRPPWF